MHDDMRVDRVNVNVRVRLRVLESHRFSAAYFSAFYATDTLETGCNVAICATGKWLFNQINLIRDLSFTLEGTIGALIL